MADKDKRLVKQAQNGDRSAFGLLVKRYRMQVLYLAFDIVGNYDDAQDVAQETFIRAFTRLHQYEDRAKFSTWLYRITVNLALDTHRKKKRSRQDALDTRVREVEALSIREEFEGAHPDERVEQNELRKVLEDGLDKLTENQRTATVLKYFHQKSSKEIAEIMGCAESTVRIHIYRALQNLKNTINY